MDQEKVTYPLSHPQKGVWYMEKIFKGSSMYNVAGTLRIEGRINFELLEKAINLIFEKNDALRLRFIEENGEPRQYVSEYKYKRLDFLDFSKSAPEEIFKWDSKMTETPFDIENEELCYFAMFKVSENEAGVYGKTHHLNSDGWSMTLICDNIIKYYNMLLKNQTPADEAPSYLEYLEKEKEYLNSNRCEKDREYWLEKLKDMPEPTIFKDSKAVGYNTRAKRKTFVLPDKLCRKLKEHCERYNISIFALFLCAFSMYVNRITGKTDIIIGTPVLNRSGVREKNTLGMFISTIPLRIKINDDLNFSEFAQEMSREWYTSLKHQKYPYDLLVRDVRTSGNHVDKLYNTILSYQNAKLVKESVMEGAKYARWHFTGHQAETLNIHIYDREDTGKLVLNYDYLTDVFYDKEIDFIHDHMIRLLWHSLDNPARKIPYIEMISEKEKRKILYEFNNTKCEYPRDKTIHQLFEEQAGIMPDDTALVFEGKTMTYGQLNSRSNQIARVLRNIGVRRDDIVGLIVNRSFDMITGMIGILKAGGAYLPIDPELPDERIRYMLEDGNVKYVLSQEALAEKAGTNINVLTFENDEISRMAGENLENVNSPSDLAYVLYTSGTTGKPKGVMVEHRSVVNFIYNAPKVIKFSRDTRVLSVTTMCFDVFVFEVFTALTSGSVVVIANNEEHKLPGMLKKLVLNKNVSTLLTTPSRMKMLIEESDIKDYLSSVKEIMLAGEVLSESLVSEMRKVTNARIVNGYGPTETTICVSFKEVGEDNDVNIGKPFSNVSIYILDKSLNLLPIGAQGDMYVGGECLSRGYLNRPELTEEKFLPNPFAEGEKMYKTGDIARWYPQGEIEYIGRKDDMVKIRGLRIELGEIESELLKMEEIKDAVVTVREDSNGRQYLCAYIICTSDIEITRIRQHLMEFLPHYMIPNYFIKMDSFPVSPSGKINRKSLPEPDLKLQTDRKYDEPESENQKLLAEIWCKIFNTGKVGIYDNFFNLGGDSLTAVQLVSELDKRGIDIGINDIYKFPTIKELGEVIRQKDNDKEFTGECCGTESGEEPAETSNIRILSGSMSEMILEERIPKLDSAAAVYMPDAFENSVLGIDRPTLFNYIRCKEGNIGLVALPITERRLYSDKDRLISLTIDAMKLVSKLGARVISLTGLIPSATDYGMDIARAAGSLIRKINVTTGHTTTAATVILSLERMLAESGRDITQEKVCVLGLGSIGTTVLKLLLELMPHPESISLCDIIQNREKLEVIKCEIKKKHKFSGSIDILFSKGTTLDNSVYESSLIIGATNVSNILDISRLKPGTLVIDDSGPHCFDKNSAVERLQTSADILFTEGGVLESSVPLEKMFCLPDNITLEAIGRLQLHMLSTYNITGCIISGLLSAKYKKLKVSLGEVDINECKKQYDMLKNLGYRGASLHCEDFVLPEKQIKAFAEKYRKRLPKENIINF